jgi:glycerophosphoryl diester phosphodiesterase
LSVAELAPHPESVLAADGREVVLVARAARWSGAHPRNSLAALEECLRAPAARAAIDVRVHPRAGFVVGQGRPPADARHVPLLADYVPLVVAAGGPTVVEIDLRDTSPLSWARVDELVRLLAPIRDRVVVTSVADWNLRRLLVADPGLAVGFDPELYLLRDVKGVASRIAEAFGTVPGARELHVRLESFEAMLDAGRSAALVHEAGLGLGVWTLDTSTPRWRDRLARIVAGGVDLIATQTPRGLACGVEDAADRLAHVQR